MNPDVFHYQELAEPDFTDGQAESAPDGWQTQISTPLAVLRRVPDVAFSLPLESTADVSWQSVPPVIPRRAWVDRSVGLLPPAVDDGTAWQSFPPMPARVPQRAPQSVPAVPQPPDDLSWHSQSVPPVRRAVLRPLVQCDPFELTGVQWWHNTPAVPQHRVVRVPVIQFEPFESITPYQLTQCHWMPRAKPRPVHSESQPTAIQPPDVVLGMGWASETTVPVWARKAGREATHAEPVNPPDVRLDWSYPPAVPLRRVWPLRHSQCVQPFVEQLRVKVTVGYGRGVAVQCSVDGAQAVQCEVY